MTTKWGATLPELDDLLDSAFDGLVITNAQGVILRINKAYERISGFSGADMVNRSVFDLMHEGYIAASAVPLVLQSRRTESVINHNRNGRHLLVTATPVFAPSGEIWRVVVNVRDFAELQQLRNELVEHQTAPDVTLRFITEHPAILKLLGTVSRVAATDTTVLLLGESGAGKEVLADLIHEQSLRRDRPLLRVNCASVPETLMEAEFFGYEKGAFTGATERGKPGYFELAHTGTLFLDEVAELPLMHQAKLLRVIQDLEVRRLGGGAPRKVDVRLIAATNQNLEERVRQGLFRADLFYRLNVITFQIPPLRERRSDVPLLAEHFLARFDAQYQCRRRLHPEAMAMLTEYSWPGNVRELRNLVERLVIMTDAEEITPSDLPPYIVRTAVGTPAPAPGQGRPAPPADRSLRETLVDTELDVIERAIREHGSIRQAAKALNINHSTLLRKLRRFGRTG